MNYLVTKNKNEVDVLFLENNINGYKLTPKIKISDGISVKEIIIVKQDFIKKLIKKKVRLMLEELDNLFDDSSDSSSDSRKALDHIQRYRRLINEKYSKFLDSKYISLLNQKIDILKRDFENNLTFNSMELNQKEYEEHELDISNKKR